MNTKTQILKKTTSQFASQGIEHFNIRDLAKAVEIAPSVIYHHFKNKDTLLRAMFDHTNTDLGIKRAQLPACQTTSEMLWQRIEFQLDHARQIVAVLKYFLAYREQFEKEAGGFIPPKGYLHIEEVLRFGIKNGELEPNTDIEADAKVITHAINGFLLEFYPDIPHQAEKQSLISDIHSFLMRGLKWHTKQ